MVDRITIDAETLKALAVGTRLRILRILLENERTLSELAEELGITPAAATEHLGLMQRAGLVSKEDTKRKWKYYSLTEKGREIVKPGEKKILFAFAVVLLSAIAIEAKVASMLHSALFPPMLTGAGGPSFMWKLGQLISQHPGIVAMSILTQVLLFASAYLLGKTRRR